MTQARLQIALLLAVSSSWPALAAGQSGSSPERQQIERQASQPDATTPFVIGQDARETRKQFEDILRRLPPTVGRVLRLDPSVMRNQSYLATYPVLAAFLQQRPDVVNNPGFYLANVTLELWEGPQLRDSRSDAVNMWRAMIQSITLFGVFLIVTGGILWLVKALLDWRRWNRSTKLQADVHTKLLDRFTANEDLLAYIQTAAGRRFLESGPLPIEHPAPPVGAPLARILWSIQAGLVVAAGGIGLLFVSRRVIEEVGQVLFGSGVLALAVGIGFVVSAAASFLLSQRLGLVEPPGRERSDPSGA